MKAFVDKDLCISCGLCIETCPDVFSWDDDDKAEAIDDEIPEEQKRLLKKRRWVPD